MGGLRGRAATPCNTCGRARRVRAAESNRAGVPATRRRPRTPRGARSRTRWPRPGCPPGVRPVRGVLLAEAGAAAQRDDAPRLAQPVAVLEDVGQRVPVVAEMLGQLQLPVECGEQRRTIGGVGQVDRRERELRVRRGVLQRLDRARPRVDAGLVEVGEVGSLHSRILENDGSDRRCNSRRPAPSSARRR